MTRPFWRYGDYARCVSQSGDPIFWANNNCPLIGETRKVIEVIAINAIGEEYCALEGVTGNPAFSMSNFEKVSDPLRSIVRP